MNRRDNVGAHRWGELTKNNRPVALSLARVSSQLKPAGNNGRN